MVNRLLYYYTFWCERMCFDAFFMLFQHWIVEAHKFGQASSWSCSPQLFQMLLMEICVTMLMILWAPLVWKLDASLCFYNFVFVLFLRCYFFVFQFFAGSVFWLFTLLMAWNVASVLRFQLLFLMLTNEALESIIPIQFGGWKVFDRSVARELGNERPFPWGLAPL